MPTIDLSFAQDPNTLSLAIIYGMIPAIAWLLFWLKENGKRPRHSGLLFGLFLGGALMVILALPVEKFLSTFTNNPSTLTILWAGAEELLKFCIFAFIILRRPASVTEPIDYAIYIMVVALGFAGFENALYFLKPLQTNDTLVLVLSGAMRFLGTTLMHAAAASFAGLALGLTFFKKKFVKIVGVLVALIGAIALHSIFNLLIVADAGTDFFQIFAGLWVITIIVLIIFERLRRMGSGEYRAKRRNEALQKETDAFNVILKTVTILPMDEAPLSVTFKNKGIMPGTPEYGRLNTFLGALRGMYIEYLNAQGGDTTKSQGAALKLIPDTITPKAISGILSYLHSAYQNTAGAGFVNKVE